jgi:NAD(P)-dependent dehydrogenase (short-subunit alcohol dehydrogenase family)
LKIELKDLFSLKNKVIVITGAAGLLGKKHAEVIAAYGGSPVLLDISFDSVAKMSDRLNRKYGVESSGYSVDITNESEIEKNLKLVVKKYGKIDGLVNNAANNPKMEEKSEKNFSRLENFKLDIWDQDVQVGLTGAFLCVKHYGFQISKNPNGGVIINISSDLGLIAPDQRLYAIEGVDSTQQSVKPVSYSVVKSGLIGLTRYVATYWADKNVRCNAMCPGGVENNQPDDFIKKVSFRIPMGRLAQKDEYLSTLIWMLSESSSYLNGAIVPIDGGRTAW